MGSIYGRVVRDCLSMGQKHSLSKDEEVGLEINMEVSIAQCTA